MQHPMQCLQARVPSAACAVDPVAWVREAVAGSTPRAAVSAAVPPVAGGGAAAAPLPHRKCLQLRPPPPHRRCSPRRLPRSLSPSVFCPSVCSFPVGCVRHPRSAAQVLLVLGRRKGSVKTFCFVRAVRPPAAATRRGHSLRTPPGRSVRPVRGGPARGRGRHGSPRPCPGPAGSARPRGPGTAGRPARRTRRWWPASLPAGRGRAGRGPRR